MIRIYASIIIFLTLFSPQLAFATFNNISGTYKGKISGIDVSCVNPADDGPYSGSFTLTLVSDDSGNITSGSGTFVNNSDGEVDTLVDISGNNDNTNFAITFNTNNGKSGNIGGTFTDSTLTILTGAVSGGAGGCIGTITGDSLSRVSAGATLVGAATPSSTVTDAMLFNTLVQSTVFGISSHIGSAMNSFISSFSPRFGANNIEMGGMLGLNAGDETGIPYGIWGNYSYTDFENDLSSTAIDGTSHGFLGGIDFRVGTATILGVALGYDNSDIDTGFNNGNQNTDTITIAPYFGSVLNDTLSVDFSVGYSNVGYDQYRTAGTNRITSSPNADRWFGSFNLNGIKFIDNWIIGGRVGALFASSVINGYTESDGTAVAASRTRVSTVSVAGDLAYSMQEWEPFLNLSYQYDYQLQEVVAATGPQPANDNDDILLSMGVRYFEKSGITGNLEYSKRLLREDFNEDRISLTVRVDY